MPNIASPSTLQHTIPSYLPTDNLGPQGIYPQQVDRVTPCLGSLARWAETLKRSRHTLVADVPIQMNDGRIARFENYRVQHNTSCGPGKGGVCFHQNVTPLEVVTLSAQMSMKNVAVNMPYGSARSDIRVDPCRLSSDRLERLTRHCTSEIGIIIGPSKGILTPDVNTNARIMAWMVNIYSMNEDSTTTSMVTGKPITLDGNLGRREAISCGVFVVSSKAARSLGIDVKGAHVVVQGFDSVGGVTAELFRDAGTEVIAVQDCKGIVFNGNGLDIDALIRHVDHNGSVAGFAAEAVLQDDFWALGCEFLILAVLESRITAENAPHIKAKVIAEGANGPTTPEAGDILRDRGILVYPDVITGVGDVTISYFEWVQDFPSFFQTEDKINRRLVWIMQDASRDAWQVAQDNKVALCTAAFIIACTRILQVRQERGLYS